MILGWLKILMLKKQFKIKILLLITLKVLEILFHLRKQLYASQNYWNPNMNQNMNQNMNLKKVIKRLRNSKKFVQGLNFCLKKRKKKIRLKIIDIKTKVIKRIQWEWVCWINMRVNRLKVCILKRLRQKIFIKKWIIILVKVVLNKLKF